MGMGRIAILILSFACMAAHAADTPQFRGPNRDGHYAETGLLKSWPEGGPPLAWKADGIGKGYASVSVVGDTIYTAGMLEDNQGYIFALALDGTLKWKAAYAPETLEKFAPGARSTPTIDGDRIYIQSGLGVLACLSAKDGTLHWSVDIATKYQGVQVIWAYAESPLVYGDLVFSTPGGPEVSVVALNKMSGEPVWTSSGLIHPSAYGSPTMFTFGKKDVFVTFLSETLIALDPKTGGTLWTHPHKVPYDIHANMPVAMGNALYYTAESGGGVVDVNEGATTVTQRWTNSDLDAVHGGVVLVDSYIYGAGYRNRNFYCLEFETGKQMWMSEEIEEGSIVTADGMLYIYEAPKKGQVSLVKASPEKFDRTGTLQIPDTQDKHWAHPAIANGRLYIRYDGHIYAYDIAAK